MEPIFGLYDEQFIICKELAKKSYNENTIIYYKNIIYLGEKSISHNENIVIKTLKKEGLPYRTKFTFKSPSIIIVKQSKIRKTVSKRIIIKGKRFDGNATATEFKLFIDSGNLNVDITIDQNSDEPFVAYSIKTRFDLF